MLNMKKNWKVLVPGILLCTCFVGVAVAAEAATQAPQTNHGGGLIGTIIATHGWMQSNSLWKRFMDFLNFVVLFALLGKFLIPLISKAVDSGLTEIETRLNSEEEEKKALELQKQEMQESLSSVEQEKEKIVADAKDYAETMKKNILEQAREQEMKILKDVDKVANVYYERKLDDLKQVLMGKVVKSFNDELKSEGNKSMVADFSSQLVKNIEVPDEK